MIKTKENCPINDIERQLKLQLEYDPDCTVIAIVPIEFEKFSSNKLLGIDSEMISMKTTHVNIIWNSR